MLETFLTISAVCALYLGYLYHTERRKNEALREHVELLQNARTPLLGRGKVWGPANGLTVAQNEALRERFEMLHNRAKRFGVKGYDGQMVFARLPPRNAQNPSETGK